MARENSYQQEAGDLLKKVQKLTEENKRLQKAVDELSTLNELAFDISGTVDSEEIMQSIIRRSIRSIEAEQGDITLVDEEKSDTAETLVRSMVSSAQHSPLHLNQNLLGWMQINKEPLMINDPDNDSRFQNVEWDESIHSLISAPLMVRSELIGILTVYNKKDGDAFTQDDLRLLSIIASQSAQVVENARLHEKEEALKKMRHEIELAASIQNQLLPKEQPDIHQYSLCGRNVTARSVGGDYYDFIPMDENRWAICLGDVSGKGMPASLLMSNLHALLRGQVNYQPSPGTLLENANQQFYQNTDPEKFVTLFFGILDINSHTVKYSSGGHDFPYLIHSDKSYRRLESGGLPLGIMDNEEYEEGEIELKPGDTLVIFSDGITDSRNSEDEAFGEDRLEQILLEGSDQTAEKLMENIFEESLGHNAQERPFDDMTLVVLSRNA